MEALIIILILVVLLIGFGMWIRLSDIMLELRDRNTLLKEQNEIIKKWQRL